MTLVPASVLDALPDVVVVLDRTGQLQYANESARVLLGHDPNAWVGRSGLELVHPDDLDRSLESLIGTADEGGRQAPTQFRVKRADGEFVLMEAVANACLDVEGIDGIVLCLRERTDRSILEQIEEAEERFSVAFEEAPIGMALVAPDGRWLRVNPAICRIVGYQKADLLQTTFQDITHPEDLELDLDHVQQMLAGEMSWYSMEKRYIHAQGHPVWVSLSVSLVRDRDGNPVHFISQIQDISAEKVLEAELLDRATKDPLTGLNNRTVLADRLTQMLLRASRGGASVALVFIDLDGFKLINDRYGHATGDTVLAELATRLRLVARPTDTVARVGGDEFIVLVEGVTAEDACSIGERLQETIEAPFVISGDSVAVMASVGVAVAESGELDGAALMERADQAMYASKAARQDAAAG